MKPRAARLMVCAFLLVLAGCATSRIDDRDVQALQHVAVVSVLGNTFHGVLVGTTAFNNNAFQADVTEWNIDGMASAYTQQLLAAKGVQASVLTIPADALPSLYLDGGVFNYSALYSIAAAQHFDTVIFIARQVDYHFKQFAPGYGLYMESFLSVSNPYPYAELYMGVLDVKTQTRRAFAYVDGPIASAPDKSFVWKPAFDDYSQDQKQALRAGVEERIRHEVARELQDMNLVPTPKPAVQH